MNRRNFLAGGFLAGAMGIGLKSYYGISLTEQSTPFGSDSFPDLINRSIEENRMADVEVTLIDVLENPVPFAEVAIEMQSHDFTFGTAVNAAYFISDTSETDPYRTELAELFNTAVLDYHHQWNPWETPADREVSNQMVSWLQQNGLSVRGHSALWQRPDIGVIPADVVESLSSSSSSDSATYLEERTTAHIRDVVGNNAGEVYEWEIINEHIDHYDVTEAINPDEPPQQSPQLVEWFNAAAEADPSANLYINEYDLISREDETHRQELEDLVSYLIDEGVPIDGVGIQGHFDGYDESVGPLELRRLLDRYASHGVDLQVTEYDTFGPGWTEQEEAEHLEIVLRTLFSHPSTVGFLMWGFWDGMHWQDNAPLFREDWSRKPAYDVYTDLVFNDWWTDERGLTDEAGTYRTTVFLGEHEITATIDNTTITEQVDITEPTTKSINLQFGITEDLNRLSEAPNPTRDRRLLNWCPRSDCHEGDNA